jgi:hypothetical protein
MAQALRAHGQTVEHLEIADEGHGFTARSTRTAVYARVLDFLTQSLRRRDDAAVDALRKTPCGHGRHQNS